MLDMLCLRQSNKNKRRNNSYKLIKCRKRGAICRRNTQSGKLQCSVEEFNAWRAQILQSRWREFRVVPRCLPLRTSTWLRVGSARRLLGPAGDLVQIQALGLLWGPIQRPCSHRRNGPVLWCWNSQSKLIKFIKFEFCFSLISLKTSKICLVDLIDGTPDELHQ